MEYVLKFGLKAAIVWGVIYYGSAYVACGVSNHCWSVQGCVNPASVEEFKRDQKLLGVHS